MSQVSHEDIKISTTYTTTYFAVCCKTNSCWHNLFLSSSVPTSPELSTCPMPTSGSAGRPALSQLMTSALRMPLCSRGSTGWCLSLRFVVVDCCENAKCLLIGFNVINLCCSQVPADHRPVRPGHRVHNERVQRPQDHPNQFPGRCLQEEPGECFAFWKPPAGPGVYGSFTLPTILLLICPLFTSQGPCTPPGFAYLYLITYFFLLLRM